MKNILCVAFSSSMLCALRRIISIQRPASKTQFRLSNTMATIIPRDVREFLDNYPDNEDDESQSANLEFYSNRRRCRPDHMFIDDIHER